MIVIVESPYLATNSDPLYHSYAIEACADCFRNGEIQFARHLHYPQILNELNKVHQEKFADAGLEYRFVYDVQELGLT